MTSDRRLPVAIVGGGFSGTMVAAQLARKGIDAVLIEKAGRAGKGIAYSTREPAHVLNVRAEVMSAWADDLEHFVRVAEAEGGTRKDFVQRRQFGRYLKEQLDNAVSSGRLRLVEREAVEARPTDGGWTVAIDGGELIQASGLVLAIGNQPPEPIPFERGNPRVINNPWGPQALAAVEDLAATNEDILLVGTGLTMVDAVLSLDAAGHSGRIVALSRRGLIPRGHDNDMVPASVEGVDVPLPEKKRFSRHARPWWDVHRHRIAPEVAQQLYDLIQQARLEIVAGRIRSVEDRDGALDVSYRRRGTGRLSEGRFAYMLNCTGPLGTISRTSDPMLRQMLGDGLIKPDELGIALDVDEHSRVVGSARAWAMGPMTKGRYWEIIAVPDIRGQAAAVADDIEAELGR